MSGLTKVVEPSFKGCWQRAVHFISIWLHDFSAASSLGLTPGFVFRNEILISSPHSKLARCCPPASYHGFQVAKDTEGKGLNEDAVRLYDLCGDYNQTITLLNR